MAAVCVAGGLGLIHAGNVTYPYEPEVEHRHPHDPDPLSHPDAHGRSSTSHYLYTGGFSLIGFGAVFLGGFVALSRKR
jgi:hypothetical protein